MVRWELYEPQASELLIVFRLFGEFQQATIVGFKLQPTRDGAIGCPVVLQAEMCFRQIGHVVGVPRIDSGCFGKVFHRVLNTAHLYERPA